MRRSAVQSAFQVTQRSSLGLRSGLYVGHSLSLTKTDIVSNAVNFVKCVIIKCLHTFGHIDCVHVHAVRMFSKPVN